jgi:alkylhydroperoxidase family enzyme
MHDDRYRAARQRLHNAILCTPGSTHPDLRQQVATQSRQLSGCLPDEPLQVPSELVSYTQKVARNAYKVIDRDIELLQEAGYSEEAIFEITLSAAFGAGMARLDCGLMALKGASHASSEH